MEKLTKIQSELNCPKGQVNQFGNYKYRSCEDILEAVKPLLALHNCNLVIRDSIELIGDRYYVKALAILSDNDNEKDKDGNFIAATATAYAREPETKKGMDVAQITGATSSYARKYALNGLFAIDDTADSDNTNKGKDDEKPKPLPVTKKPDPKQTIADNAQSAIDRKTISNDDLEGAGHSMKEELMDKMDGEQVDKKEEIKALAEKIYSGTDENLWKAAAMVGKHALETDTDPSVVCENWTENEGVDKEGKPKFWNGKKSLDGMKNPKAHYACYKQIEGHYLAVYHPEN